MTEFNKIYETVINESSLSRIWQYIEEPSKSFGVISAYIKGFTDKTNKLRHKCLISNVKRLKYGFIEQKGGYRYDGDNELTNEKSLFVPNITKKDIIDLGVDYKQETVIYKDQNEFSLIGTNEKVGIGKVVGSFEQNTGKENFDFSKDTLYYVFSSLLKGSHKNKKYAFSMK